MRSRIGCSGTQRPFFMNTSTNQRTSQSVLVPVGRRGSPSETGSLMVKGLNDDLPVRRRMVTGSEISMESLILAQDERWRRA